MSDVATLTPCAGTPFPGSRLELDHISEQIRFDMAASSGMTLEVMDSAVRSEEIFWPRASAMFLIRRLTPVSSGAIGNMFGGRDHGTVLNALKKVRNRCETDRAYLTWISEKLDHYMELFAISADPRTGRNWRNK